MELNLILGPMFSGKTSELLRRYSRTIIADIPSAIIKYKGDNRYSKDVVKTHNGNECSATYCVDELMPLLYELTPYKIVFIDEIQFFPDKVQFCKLAIQSGIEIHAAGLAQDYMRKPFVDMDYLYALAYNVVYLQAICFYCKNDRACYTERFSHSTEQFEIGGSDKYHAVCSICWNLASLAHGGKK